MNWFAVINSLRRQSRSVCDDSDRALREGNLTTANGHIVVASILFYMSEALRTGVAEEIGPEQYSTNHRPFFPPEQPK